MTHLRPSTFVITDPELCILYSPETLDDDVISIHQRLSETPSLEYGIRIMPRSRAGLIESLNIAIGVLAQLPEDGTLANIAESMGATLSELEV